MAGRFKKINRIGRGTFGEAWLVSSVCSGRKYVIKEVRVDEMSEEELEKTRTEATILARCKHNSIIRYKEYFMLPDPATMCLVMEYADGGDLAEKVKAAKQNGMMIPESTILHWFIQVIFAVQYLHTNNILHRDLKTQNIFLTKTNLVKVGDFGIARFLRDKQDLATTAIGTPYYLSPEICQRRPYNYKSDMWAVGCILYELCALRHPFDAENFEDLVMKILKGAFRPLPSSFSGLLKDLISVMLRTNPERRPTADSLLMLPALKPYVENYLMQYEELLNKRERASSSDDKLSINAANDYKEDSPLQELHSNLKVRELDKNAMERKRKDANSDELQSPALSATPRAPKSHRLDSVSTNSPDSDLCCTPPKKMCLIEGDSHPLSSPTSPLHIKTPAYKYSSVIRSPVPPPAPPNTPVNKQFSSTPPNIHIVNILSIYPHCSNSSSSEASPVHIKLPNNSSSNANVCRTSCYAPTPYNTPTELRIPCNMSPSRDDFLGASHRSFSPCKTSPRLLVAASSVNRLELEDLQDCEPLSSPVKDLASDSEVLDAVDLRCKDMVINNIFCSRKCKTCGRGFSDTYIIEKACISEKSSKVVSEL